jgi:hypothetical protein
MHPNGELYFGSTGVQLGDLGSHTGKYGAQSIGMFIVPMFLWTAVTMKGLVGTFYNTIVVTGMEWETTVYICPHARVVYGGRTYVTLPDQPRHGNVGMMALQLEGDGV